MNYKISVVGLGKLGACFAAVLAAKRYDVVGVDINKEYVAKINRGEAPFYEPQLMEYLKIAKKRLKATTDYKEAVHGCDAIFLILPTLSQKDGNFSDKYLKDSLKNLALHLKRSNKKNILFSIVSTVSPGTTENSLMRLIEKISSKRLNHDFFVCYSPTFIALGSVIHDFLNPDVVLIGESNKRAGDMLLRIFDKVIENNPYVARMSIISSEIAKISLNAYITMKISFANTLSNICESVKGAELDKITQALGADKRIAPYYLKGGVNYGGPCFPRDNRAFSAFAKKHGVDTLLAKATDKINNLQIRRIVTKVLINIAHNHNKKVVILGLSYKPSTAVIEESTGVKIIEALLSKKVKDIWVYDPLAMSNAKLLFADKIKYAKSVKESFKQASVCVITTPESIFKDINQSYIHHNPTTIIDCWRIIDAQNLGKKVKYIPLGKNIS